MKLDYNCTGADRKNLVAVLADHTGQKAKYLGAPSFAYQVGYITVDKNGNLHMNDHADPDVVQNLIDGLAERGFQHTAFSYDCPQPEPEVVDELLDEEPDAAEPATEEFEKVVTVEKTGNKKLDRLNSILGAK